MVQAIESQESGSGLPALLADTVAWLSDIAVQGLTQAERLQVVETLEAAKGVAAAVQARATDSFVAERDADAQAAAARGEISRRAAARARSAARAEVALARRCSPGQADRHVGLAQALTHELPCTMTALTAGDISEWRATIVARETACLTRADRLEADRRLAGELTRLGDKALAGAARRATLDLDPDAVVERRSRAVPSRCVTVRPAPDGMAYLSILGSMIDVVGAQASLTMAEKARFVATGDPVLDNSRAEDDRSRGAWMADTALERLSGRAADQAQPIEVCLVMSESAFFPGQDGHADHERSEGGTEVPGWGAVPASAAREHLLTLLEDDEQLDDESTETAGVWLRRLWTGPGGRDLVAMDSARRLFSGSLRRLLQLRDPVCRMPWCDAPARQVDHIHPVARGGHTVAINAAGLCQRHNLVKEEPGWSAEVTVTGLDPGGGPHEFHLTTPTGREHRCVAAPLFGHGRQPRTRAHPESELERTLERFLDAA
ncbi:HNH endonuclease signature motif containing protein [Janibacter cremeus]|uniref:HNH nuclease domain-containing protein n=1 Tax=Janibacter cremeus TaxID=1285192 RepID=A0A852VTA8_9MICO|nr:HNH endonuclease signature motif containing protein [Janibacter cremeus]NYF99566.1 hypothetical protein [Janibacter cremeus]